MTQLVRIPITGQIRVSRLERAFCKLAHAFLREVDFGLLEYCPYRTGETCGLAGGLAPCLFDDPDAPEWAIIAQSVELERLVSTS